MRKTEAEYLAEAEKQAEGKSFDEVMYEFREGFAELRRQRLGKKPAEVVPFPPLLSEQDLIRRQLVEDANWRHHLRAKAELERELQLKREWSYHRGPGDPDYGW
jgi:hypothetical protein